jgi:hypothetical protein
MISAGMGVNSIAMIIMEFKKGNIMPVVFADTGVEMPETYCYMDYFEKEFMSKYDVKITKLHPKTHPHLYRNDIKGMNIEEYCIKYHMIPLGFFRFCTQRWKIEPQDSFSNVTRYIGFAYDERHRAETAIKRGDNSTYPLIDKKVTRDKCYEIIDNEGLSRPIKSGCFFCPMQRISQWENLYREHRSLYDRAEFMEKNCVAKIPEDKRRELKQKYNTLNPERIAGHCDLEAEDIIKEIYDARKAGKILTLRPTGPTLEIMRERFESKGGNLFPNHDFEEITPCQCIL